MAGELFEAIARGDEELVRELLERRPEAAEERDGEGVSAVRRALYAGQGGIATALLDANPALDVFDAAAAGRTRGLQELLDAEPALALAWARDGFTALHLAAFFGHDEAVEQLLEAGADVNAVARNAELQVAPLHSAAAGAHAGIVASLLEHGADPNTRQGGGFTPLHAAAQNGDRKSVEALLASGADPALANDEGSTPGALARAAGHDELARLLTS
jgi:ankyrin repeat protein